MSVAASCVNRVYLLGDENASIRWQDSLSIVTGDTDASSIFARMEGLVVDLSSQSHVAALLKIFRAHLESTAG